MSGTLSDPDILEESGWVVSARANKGINVMKRRIVQTVINEQGKTVMTRFILPPLYYSRIRDIDSVGCPQNDVTLWSTDMYSIVSGVETMEKQRIRKISGKVCKSKQLGAKKRLVIQLFSGGNNFFAASILP